MAAFFHGPSDWSRTSGLLNPIQARYQTALHPDIARVIIPHLAKECKHYFQKSFGMLSQSVPFRRPTRIDTPFNAQRAPLQRGALTLLCYYAERSKQNGKSRLSKYLSPARQGSSVTPAISYTEHRQRCADSRNQRADSAIRPASAGYRYSR